MVFRGDLRILRSYLYMVTVEDIKKLRDQTGHSISKCKEALEESGGSMEKAQEVLREKGALAAQKKADRNLGSGVIQSYIHTTNRIGAMVELLCETDFVARNEDFLALARDIAMHCAAFQPHYVSQETVPQDVLDQVTVELKEGVDSSKSPEVQENMLQGMVAAKLKEVVLLDQGFVRDDKRTVGSLIEEFTQKFGERISLGRFVVWTL